MDIVSEETVFKIQGLIRDVFGSGVLSTLNVPFVV